MENNNANNEDMKIEDLALMVQRGFEQTATKADLETVKNELGGLRAEMSEMKDELKSELSHLNVRLSGVEDKLKDEVIHREEFNDLTSRVKYTEVKLGVQSGK